MRIHFASCLLCLCALLAGCPGDREPTPKTNVQAQSNIDSQRAE